MSGPRQPAAAPPFFKLRLLLLLALALPAPSLPAAAEFSDATLDAGLIYLQHQNPPPPGCIFSVSCEPERMAGGAAVGDVDGDGDPDLLVTRMDGHDILFRNDGTGHFSDMTAFSGLDQFILQSNGAGFADLDNDGDQDLVVLTLGTASDPVNNRNYLFINDGTGRFTEEAAARGADCNLGEDRRMWSVAFGDFDKDGWLDIHTTEWMPGATSNSRLLRNKGAAAPGHFEDVTDAAGVRMEASHGFASAFTDLDLDGWPDLAMAADFGTSRLFWNNGDGTFTDGTAAAGVGTDENGMGSTFGDYDGDGDLDWFVTSIFDPNDTCSMAGCVWGITGNRLYRNEGNRAFSDATDEAGVRDGYWGWGTAFFDFDNDRDLDLVMTNGVDFPGSLSDDAFNLDPMRLWRNEGPGPMTEMAGAAGITDARSGKGLLVFDADGDGDQDLFVVNNAETPVFYRNDAGQSRSWLRVRTTGSVSNRDGIGARIELRREAPDAPQVVEVGSASHFLGQSERTAHFGLGDRDEPVSSVRIHWPSGTVQVFRDVPPRTTLEAVEPACADRDEDGHCGDSDCDDSDPSVHDGAPELPGNDVDENCDGRLDRCTESAAGLSRGRYLQCVRLECLDLMREGLLTRDECKSLFLGAARRGPKPGHGNPAPHDSRNGARRPGKNR